MRELHSTRLRVRFDFIEYLTLKTFKKKEKKFMLSNNV